MNPPGISIISRIPLWREGADTWHLTQQIHKYNHVIEAMGGYWSSEFTIRGGRNLADDWLQDGLGRHIDVYDGALAKIWEGFVDRVTVNYGPLSVVRGPLLDIANRINISYCPITYDEDDNPIVGTRVNTVAVNDTDSQALWGIIPKVLTTSDKTAAQATGLQAAYLANNSLPVTGQRFRSDTAEETSVTVTCAGYVRWLNWPYYATTGPIAANTKVAAVLADTPNAAWLTYDTEHVDANTLTVPGHETENNLAWSVIKDTVARGDAANNRWLFGIYDNRKAHYKAAPTVVEYQQRLSQSRPIIERSYGDQVVGVYPWQVRPGRWIMYPDFLIGQAVEFSLRDDPRVGFIEQVKYTMPNTLELVGSVYDTMTGTMARMGLSGIGA